MAEKHFFPLLTQVQGLGAHELTDKNQASRRGGKADFPGSLQVNWLQGGKFMNPLRKEKGRAHRAAMEEQMAGRRVSDQVV